MGSTLFAATMQPILINIATTFDNIVVTAYADNVVFSGPMSQVCKAYHEYCIDARKVGLELNPSDSQTHIPAWKDKTKLKYSSSMPQRQVSHLACLMETKCLSPPKA